MAQRALEGFVRAVAKELRQGATAQLLWVEEGAEANLGGALGFFLSPRSAYVSGQSLRLQPASLPPHAPTQPLAGRQILVTGAARGIGVAVAETLARDGARYDPRVAARIQRGAQMSAWEYLNLVQGRARWIARMQRDLGALDAVLSPTVPITAPTRASVAPGAERDEAFFRTNALLLRNPSAINFLDGCALSLPCHRPDELPVGLMLWQGAMHDESLLQLALQVEAALRHQEH